MPAALEVESTLTDRYQTTVPEPAYEGNDDAYRVFRGMLECGHPPDGWNQLLAKARAEGQRLQLFAAALPVERQVKSRRP